MTITRGLGQVVEDAEGRLDQEGYILSQGNKQDGYHLKTYFTQGLGKVVENAEGRLDEEGYILTWENKRDVEHLKNVFYSGPWQGCGGC